MRSHVLQVDHMDCSLQGVLYPRWRYRMGGLPGLEEHRAQVELPLGSSVTVSQKLSNQAERVISMETRRARIH